MPFASPQSGQCIKRNFRVCGFWARDSGGRERTCQDPGMSLTYPECVSTTTTLLVLLLHRYGFYPSPPPHISDLVHRNLNHNPGIRLPAPDSRLLSAHRARSLTPLPACARCLHTKVCPLARTMGKTIRSRPLHPGRKLKRSS